MISFLIYLISPNSQQHQVSPNYTSAIHLCQITIKEKKNVLMFEQILLKALQ